MVAGRNSHLSFIARNCQVRNTGKWTKVLLKTSLSSSLNITDTFDYCMVTFPLYLLLSWWVFFSLKVLGKPAFIQHIEWEGDQSHFVMRHFVHESQFQLFLAL